MPAHLTRLRRARARATREEEPTDNIPHGHVTSISVLRSYRRLGLAQQLMRQSQVAMRDVFGARYCSLHVRKTNRAAIGLYRDTLGFEVHDTEKGYCEFRFVAPSGRAFWRIQASSENSQSTLHK